MKKNYSKSVPKEINVQKKDIFKTYHSNSLIHYKDISSYNYEHRIRLDPSGEKKTTELRCLFPISLVRDCSIKSDYLSESKNNKETAFEKANIQSKITSHIKKQNYQNLLEKNKYIEQLCHNKNKEIKSELDERKNQLKKALTRIITDALIFSKKNNPIKAMLPDNINEIVEEVKKKTKDMSLSLSMSNLSGVSSLKGESKRKKNEFLSLLGVDLDNLSINNVNFDINKVWNFVNRLAKGRNIEEILRCKVVNAIMSMAEKKASEQAKIMYEKLDIYKKFMEKKKMEKKAKKEKEEDKNNEELLKTNPKEYIRLKMIRSVSQPKLLNKTEKKNDKIGTGHKKMKKSESVILTGSHKNVIKLHSYNNVNQIINFIDNSRKKSQSKLYKKHFTNIQMTKSMDLNLLKMLKKNQIKC
jgi:hypothetical protein